MNANTSGHDIVVVGASAGGVQALTRLVGGLPADFSASMFVVLHLPPDAPSALATILNRAGPLPAVAAEHKQPIEPGRIYVARPNRHLVVRRGHVTLEAGPRENSARPAVDVLFRSAARAYGRRTVGVVLSGTLRDGALGLAAIKMRGGVTIVQDPAEALFGGMPESALRTTEIDYCLPSSTIPKRLVELTQHAVEREPMPSQPPLQPTVHAADEPDSQFSPKLPNAASGLTCPECHGSLWELKEGASLRFECRIGHTYSVDGLLAEQGETVEAALWAAVNALQERAATFRRLAGSTSIDAGDAAFDERAELVEHQAQALLGLLRGLIADGQVGGAEWYIHSVIDGIIRGEGASQRNWAAAVQTYRSALVTYRRLLETRAGRIGEHVDVDPRLRPIVPLPPRSEHLATHTPSLDHDVLTPREREVVELLARGYSNRRIAEALVLTRGTVANHVAHILAKLGAANRTQVAAWVFDRTTPAGDEGALDDDWHRLVS